MNDKVDNETRLSLVLVFSIVTAVVIASILFAAKSVFQKDHAKPISGQTHISTFPTSSATSFEDDFQVIAEHGVVKFYFAVDQAVISSDSSNALLSIITAVQSGKTAVISGFTDSSGNAEHNAKLSHARAEAVRAELIRLNVPADKIELRKPEFSTGTGSATQARRVEVWLKD